MPLINLEHLRYIYYEARHNKDIAIRQSFNLPPDKDRLITPMADGLYVQLIKTHAQAKVIYKNIKRLHKACSDFTQGNFQPYIDRHNRDEIKYVNNPEYRTEYEPLAELDIPFNDAIDYPLPQRIEQYTELLNLCKNFTEVRRLKRNGENKFFGDEPMYYEVIDDEGERAILHPSELPEDYVNELAAKDSILSIQAEYAFDNYNAFYDQARNYMLEAHESRDVVKGARNILSLFTSTTPL